MLDLTNEKVLLEINARFSDHIKCSSAPYELLTVEVESTETIRLIKFLKEDSELSFAYLTDLCGIHYPQRIGQELGIVYHLHNMRQNIRIRVKTFLPITNPKIQSLTSLFKGANWMERETYDFYGIIFEGHPDLRRILNVDDMVAFPMRKEHPLEDPNRIDKKDEYFGR